ncbi:Cytochrome c oxidase subunit 5B, mitochondrial [Ophiophagus hannah]|uniref:Cytochrome c oxidase subunit 5B, mitochondrial n=1 Tax=Ophiophagus hannah TaxID=8665 RepID=V8N4R3_OPHHA|nr:Cytochrome c oxidase subunit 5B, mitochondrial [Ophiophagus hannah]
MASRLLRVSGALRALRVGPAADPFPGPGDRRPSREASSGGMATDEEQATGMERKVLDTIKKGVARKMPRRRTTFGFTKTKWSAALRVGPTSNWFLVSCPESVQNPNS